MNINRTRRWGFIFLFAGFIIGIPGVWLLLATKQYEATVRIQVEHEPDPNSYDPYFLQTEFEVIKSDPVLTKVVESLHLDEEWGKRYNNGHKLELREAIGLLKQSLKMAPVRNTRLVEITFTSEEPAEAANVANGIAAAYIGWRKEQYAMLQNSGIQALKDQQVEQQKKISMLQTYVNRLLLEKDSPTLTPEDRVKKNQDYSESTNELERVKNLNGILETKISAMPKVPADATRIAIASVIDPATTPTAPTKANRRAGKILLWSGVLLILSGVRLLWRAYFAAPDPAS